MGRIADLYALQELDLALEARRRRLAEVEEQLGEDEALLAARQAWDEAQGAHHELAASQRELEWQLQEAEERLGLKEKKLYGGSITNPKELQGLQEEAMSLKRHKGQAEEGLLVVMLQD